MIIIMFVLFSANQFKRNPP